MVNTARVAKQIHFWSKFKWLLQQTGKEQQKVKLVSIKIIYIKNGGSKSSQIMEQSKKAIGAKQKN